MKHPYFLFTFLLIGLTLSAQSFRTEDIRFRNDTLELAAEVFLPNEDKSNGVGVALIQGSGPSGRDNLWARAFAELLAEAGFTALLPDKRGVGQSKGDWRFASFEALAEDALASAHFLAGEYGLEKVGLMGLSQGGFIAPIAASKDTEVAFVANIVGSAVPLEEQIIHEVMNTALDEGLSPEAVKEVLELHVLMKHYVQTGEWKPLQTRYRELERSEWAAFAKTFPQDKDSWVWEWIRLNFSFDPLPYWKKVEQPVFVAYGAKDQFDNMPVWENVYRLQTAFFGMDKRNYEIHVYDAGHALYEDGKTELRSEMKEGLIRWLAQWQ